jgi:CheY-like chemotaxis protein
MRSALSPAQSGASTLPAAKGGAVLLCDDDPALLRTLELVIRRTGRAVETTCNGLEALAALRERRFLCLVTDIIMPELEGLELIQRLRHLQADIPIVAMSGGGRGYSAEYLNMARLLGAVYTLEKPFRAEHLIAVLELIERGETNW